MAPAKKLMNTIFSWTSISVTGLQTKNLDEEAFGTQFFFISLTNVNKYEDNINKGQRWYLKDIRTQAIVRSSLLTNRE